jgi:hypothetical protein
VAERDRLQPGKPVAAAVWGDAATDRGVAGAGGIAGTRRSQEEDSRALPGGEVSPQVPFGPQLSALELPRGGKGASFGATRKRGQGEKDVGVDTLGVGICSAFPGVQNGNSGYKLVSHKANAEVSSYLPEAFDFPCHFRASQHDKTRIKSSIRID